jgi:hypothetical protein
VDIAAEPIMAREDAGVLAHHVPACLAFPASAPTQAPAASHCTATATSATNDILTAGIPYTARSSLQASTRTDARASIHVRDRVVRT